MDELRRDVTDDIDPRDFEEKIDKDVRAPGEHLEENREVDPDYEVDHTLARAGTGYDPKDPALR